jgi:hypothetical protein
VAVLTLRASLFDQVRTSEFQLVQETRPAQCSACIAPVPSHTLHLLLPDRLHAGQPLPLQASHFVVPLPLHVGQSFMFAFA